MGSLTARDGDLRLQITPALEHVTKRGNRDGALNYLSFWHDNLRKADLVL